ncbi:hypothetical protein HXZ62_03065 [Empedobacter falsenii]|uniref:hypothetical protein n=1 Tax=Empedobacter falsenii TaxID=343874 RepID=UPI002577357B|nr:hypothetical protein [Empedobacter falsenii]MDM1061541.1 hypothetical protein [Empedobacter falsenii]
MKKIVFFFVLVTFPVMISFAQKNDKVKSEEIKTIKANFSRINSIKNWTKIKEVETDDSTEGGFINYYFLNDKLKKIVVRKFGESGQYLAEYYLLNNKLSFVFEQDTTYNFPLYWKEFNDKKSKIEEFRYYFEDRKLILFIGKSENYKTESENTLVEFDELIKIKKMN